MKKVVSASILVVPLVTGCSSSGNLFRGGSDVALTTSTGMTLYTFDKDADNLSNCYDACAVKWPPYLNSDGEAPSAGANLTIRRDGSEQWTLNKKPLYTWVGDKKPGDNTGNGIGNVWHTAIREIRQSTTSSTDY